MLEVSHHHDVVELIDDVVSTVPGWTPPDELLALYVLAQASLTATGDLVEIGSWCGRSAIILASALRLQADRSRRLHAVDLFPEKEDWFENTDGSFSFRVNLEGQELAGHVDQTVWREPYLRDILPVYENFQGTRQAFDHFTAYYGVSEYINVIRGTSDELNKIDNLQVRLAFIDAGHSFVSVVRDITNISSALLPGGWICFDDAFSTYDGVSMAIHEKIIESTDFFNMAQITRKLFVAQTCKLASESRRSST